MDMRVDKPGQNKLFTVLRHLRVWMCGLQRGRIAYGFNLTVTDQDTTGAVNVNSVLPCPYKGVARIGQNLTAK